MDPMQKSTTEDKNNETVGSSTDSGRESEGVNHRNLGNDHFSQKRYLEAESCYSRAIDLNDRDYLSFGNRAAARLQLQKFSDSLLDASESIKLCSTYIKGYYRKAIALESLGMTEEFWKTCRIAAILVPENEYFSSQSRIVFPDVLDIYRSEEPSSTDRWHHIFATLPDPRERLATLARFWNVSSKPERMSILHRFLQLIGGTSSLPEASASVSHPYLAEEYMITLPLANYNDIPKNNAWSLFFIKSSDKLCYVNDRWNECNDLEQGQIIGDLKIFFSQAYQENEQIKV